MANGSASESGATEAVFQSRLDLARRLADRRDYADAIVLFDWLQHTYPSRVELLVDAAIPFVRTYDYARLDRLLARLDASAAPTVVLLAAARICQQVRRTERAQKYLKRAVKEQPTADACAQLAEHFERASDLPAALEWAERATFIDPAGGAGRLALAKALDRLKRPAEAMPHARAVFEDARIRPDVRVASGYALAQLYDRADDPDAAMATLLATKRLAETLPAVIPAVARWRKFEKLGHDYLKHLTPGYFEATARYQPANSRRLALLAGHPRSGTTLLEQVLDAHEDVISAEETTVFIDKVFDATGQLPSDAVIAGNPAATALAIPRERLNQLREEYFNTIDRVLGQPVADRLLLDKNPSTTDLLPAFVRNFPDAKLIIALRDPRDVILSCFFQPFPINDVSISFLSLPDAARRYAFTMAMWLVCRESMDESAWIEVRYETLVDNFADESKRVTRWLGLDYQPAQAEPDVHARSRTVVSPSYAQVKQPVHRSAVGRWKRYEKWLGETEPVLQTFLEAFEYE